MRVHEVCSVGVRERNKQSPDVLVHMCGGGKGAGGGGEMKGKRGNKAGSRVEVVYAND